MEYLDALDQFRQQTGRQMKRGDYSNPDEYHLIIHVCLFNESGQMLIQKRQTNKRRWPNTWDLSVNGAVSAGETSQQAATRELNEELGLDIDLTNQRPDLTLTFEGGFTDVYLLTLPLDIEQLTLQESEVQAVKWATADEIKARIQDGLFLPYQPSLIDFLFAINKENIYYMKK